MEKGLKAFFAARIGTWHWYSFFSWVGLGLQRAEAQRPLDLGPNVFRPCTLKAGHGMWIIYESWYLST